MSHLARWSLKALVLALAIPAASQVAAQQKITIDGSTGTAPLIDALGKAFTAKHGIAIEVGKGLGTKARFEALSGGKIDIAMASHGLNVADITKRGMTVYRIARKDVGQAHDRSMSGCGPTVASLDVHSSMLLGAKRTWFSRSSVIKIDRPRSSVTNGIMKNRKRVPPPITVPCSYRGLETS
jgi:hypothetical protein